MQTDSAVALALMIANTGVRPVIVRVVSTHNQATRRGVVWSKWALEVINPEPTPIENAEEVNQTSAAVPAGSIAPPPVVTDPAQAEGTSVTSLEIIEPVTKPKRKHRRLRGKRCVPPHTSTNVRGLVPAGEWTSEYPSGSSCCATARGLMF